MTSNRLQFAGLAAYVKVSHHLPGIPAESEIVGDGLGTGGMLAMQSGRVEAKARSAAAVMIPYLSAWRRTIVPSSPGS